MALGALNGKYIILTSYDEGEYRYMLAADISQQPTQLCFITSSIDGKTIYNRAAMGTNNIVEFGSGGEYAVIRFNVRQISYNTIRAYTADQWGLNLVMDGGGNTILGAGESGNSIYTNNIDRAKTGERLYLSSDNEVFIYSNCNTIGNRKTWKFDNSGNLFVPGNVRPINQSQSFSYVNGAKGQGALVYAPHDYNRNYWYPTMTIQTKGGGSWQVGNYDNELLRLVYFSKAKIDASTNSPDLNMAFSEGANGIIIPKNVSFRGLTMQQTGFQAVNTGTLEKPNTGSANIFSSVYVLDKNSNWTGAVEHVMETNGNVAMQMLCRRWSTKATTPANVSNNIKCMVTPAGAQTYFVSNAANFRSAIGASASSDRRLKNNIKLLGKEATDFIKELKPASYVINGKNEVGLIAQDVKESDRWNTSMAFETEDGVDGLDEWEKMDDGSPTWKLDYIRIIPPLVKALQDALERIDELERKLR